MTRIVWTSLLLALLLLAGGCAASPPAAAPADSPSSGAMADPLPTAAPAPATTEIPVAPAPTEAPAPAALDRTDPAAVHAAWVDALRLGDLAAARGLLDAGAIYTPEAIVTSMGQLVRGEPVGGVDVGPLQEVALLGESDAGGGLVGVSAWRFEGGETCFQATIGRDGGAGWRVEHWQQARMDVCDEARARPGASPVVVPAGGETSPFVSIPDLEIPALVNRADPAAVNAALVAALLNGDLATVELLYQDGPYWDESRSPAGLVREMGGLAWGGEHMGQELGAFLGAEPLGVYAFIDLAGRPAGLSLWSFAAGSMCFAATLAQDEGTGDWVVYDWVRATDAACADAKARLSGR